MQMGLGVFYKRAKVKIMINLFIKQEQAYRLRERTYGYQESGEGLFGSVGSLGTHCYTLENE